MMRRLILLSVLIVMSGCCEDRVSTEQVKELFKDIKTLKVANLGGKTVVDGYVLNYTDLKKIRIIEKEYAGKGLVSLVSLNKDGEKALAEIIEKDIDNPNIYVTVHNGVFILNGSESYPKERDLASQIANVFTRGLSDDKSLIKLVPSNGTIGEYFTSGMVINNIMKIRKPLPPPTSYKLDSLGPEEDSK